MDFYSFIVGKNSFTDKTNDWKQWQSYVNNIYSDSKAHRVGDIISVILSENTQAQKNAKTELSKENTSALDPIIGLGGSPLTFKNDNIQKTAHLKTENI